MYPANATKSIKIWAIFSEFEKKTPILFFITIEWSVVWPINVIDCVLIRFELRFCGNLKAGIFPYWPNSVNEHIKRSNYQSNSQPKWWANLRTAYSKLANSKIKARHFQIGVKPLKSIWWLFRLPWRHVGNNGFTFNPEKNKNKNRNSNHVSIVKELKHIIQIWNN